VPGQPACWLPEQLQRRAFQLPGRPEQVLPVPEQPVLPERVLPEQALRAYSLPEQLPRRAFQLPGLPERVLPDAVRIFRHRNRRLRAYPLRRGMPREVS